jgi:hypothetical protein
MSIFRLIRGDSDGTGVPATRYDREIQAEAPTPYDIVVWVGLDQEGLEALLQNGRCIADDVITRLQAMVDEGTLSLVCEYTVRASVTMSGAVEVTVEASSEDEAHDMASDMIRDGEGLDDFYDNSTVDDVVIEGVETT